MSSTKRAASQRHRRKNAAAEKKYTGNRGNEAADKLANMGAEIEEMHRVVERGSAEPPQTQEEHKDNG